jgi:hypothetical protein
MNDVMCGTATRAERRRRKTNGWAEWKVVFPICGLVEEDKKMEKKRFYSFIFLLPQAL